MTEYQIPNITPTPAAAPEPLAGLVAARDAAFDTLNEYTDANEEILRDDWESIAARADRAAATAAVRAGTDTKKLKPTVTGIRDQRPTVLGVADALSDTLRTADNQVRDALPKACLRMLPAAGAAIKAAETAYLAAYQAMSVAKENYGTALGQRRALEYTAKGGEAGAFDLPDSPMRYDGMGFSRDDLAAPLLVAEVNTNAAQLGIDKYCEHVGDEIEPLTIQIKSLANGAILELRPDAAAVMLLDMNNGAECVLVNDTDRKWLPRHASEMRVDEGSNYRLLKRSVRSE